MINVDMDIDRELHVDRMINVDLDIGMGLFVDRMINVLWIWILIEIGIFMEVCM